MKPRLVTAFAAAITVLAASFTGTVAADSAKELKAAVESPLRTPVHAARDKYRNPYETLRFFDIEPNMTVVEISPGRAGWYMEILAPYLKKDGVYYAASYDQSATGGYAKSGNEQFQKKLKSNPDMYERVKVTEFSSPSKLDIAPANSADRVLTFRNVHNWMMYGGVDEAFGAFYKALKPGGILGIVEHRARNDQPQDPSARNGYVREDYVIKLAEAAGFRFLDKSEINANPRDTADHGNGVWQLPPRLYGGSSKEKAIGESDRMTLKFVKPKG